jgi:NAD(P)-dependent dehydrogenase (short-subunit alcohol dehydrogenase family)
MTSTDRTALVTGAARGIGFAIAERFIAEGTRVALVDLDGAAVTAAAAQLGQNALAVIADVTKTEDVERAVATPVERWGRVDVVVNNAGITGRSFPIWELSDDDWQSVIACDLTSVFLVCRATIRHMLAAGGGRIVNIASVAGKDGNPTLVPYSTAKAGVIGLTKAAARELAHWNVLVNAVAPGLIETDMAAGIPPAAREALMAQVPLKRIGTAREVAAAVRFLAGDGAGYITGQVIHVNGGLYM